MYAPVILFILVTFGLVRFIAKKKQYDTKLLIYLRNQQGKPCTVEEVYENICNDCEGISIEIVEKRLFKLYLRGRLKKDTEGNISTYAAYV